MYLDSVLEHSEGKSSICVIQGTKKNICKYCKKSCKDAYTGALGHAWDNGKVTKKATCTKNGEKTYSCENCHKTRTEVVKATGHVFTHGKCLYCGKKDTAKPSKPSWGWNPGWWK